MTDQQEADTQQLDAHEALIQEGKALGLKQAANMKPETLQSKIDAIKARQSEAPPDYDPKKTLEVALIASDFDKKYLNSINFDFEWLKPLAAQYGIEKFEYIHKFRAFRVYKGGKHVDWVDVNDFGLLNGKRNMATILLKHAPVRKDRRLLDFHWRA